jgi:hypothetical protein
MSENNTLDLENLDSNEPSNVEEVVEDVEPEEVAEEPEEVAEEPEVDEEPAEPEVSTEPEVPDEPEVPAAPSTEEVVENVKEILTEPVATTSESTDLEERVKVLEERLESLVQVLKDSWICNGAAGRKILKNMLI